MARSRKSPRSRVVAEVVAVVLLGALLGSALAGLGQALGGEGPVMSFLTRTWRLGPDPPLVLDLTVLRLTIGLTFDVGLLTVLGIAASVLLYARMR